MAAEGVTAEQNNVHRQHEGSDADAERSLAWRRVLEPHGFPDIAREEQQENQGEIKEIAVNVLQDQRKGILAPIRFPRFGYGAGRRVGPERFVIGAAIVVAGETKSSRRPKDQERR